MGAAKRDTRKGSSDGVSVEPPFDKENLNPNQKKLGTESKAARQNQLNERAFSTKEENRGDSESNTNWFDTAIDYLFENVVYDVVASLDEDFVKEVLGVTKTASTFVLKGVHHSIRNIDNVLGDILEADDDESDEEESITEEYHGEDEDDEDKKKKVKKDHDIVNKSTKTGKSMDNKITPLMKLRRVVSGLGTKKYSEKRYIQLD